MSDSAATTPSIGLNGIDVLKLVALILCLFGLRGAMLDSSEMVDVVVTTTDLEPFAVLTPENLAIEQRSDTEAQGFVSSLDKVVGRLTLTGLANAAIVNETDTADPASMAGRTLVTVRITESLFTPGIGGGASLVMSPTTMGFDGVVVNDVIVVKITGSGASAQHTLAVAPSDLEVIAPLLAVSDLRLVYPT